MTSKHYKLHVLLLYKALPQDNNNSFGKYKRNRTAAWLHVQDSSISILLFTVYKDMSEAVKKHPEADILVNFASLRSAYDSTMEALTYKKVH